MILHRGRKVVAALLLSVVLLTTACTTKHLDVLIRCKKKALNKERVKR